MHIRHYMDRYRTDSARTRLVVNHLVDYDCWLQDGPGPGSAHLAQIELMGSLARVAARRHDVDIRTFAGFCPLKHALEVRRGEETTLSRLIARRGRHGVSGFKLYPPMGFKPWGNAELRAADFSRPTGADVVLPQWLAAGGSAEDNSLGMALDAALEAFYRECEVHGLPIMAHAGPSNEAHPGWRMRAEIKHWEQVRARHPTLRISLGHLVNQAQPFVRVVMPDTAVPCYDLDLDDVVWARDSPLRLFAADSSPSLVWGDLSYMPELMEDAGLARNFFLALKQHLAPVDPDLEHILYGSDWIMMGNEPRDERYLGTIIRGMEAASYSERQIDNILWANAFRWLGEPS